MWASSSREFGNRVKIVLEDVEKRSGLAPDNPDFVALRCLLKRRVREIAASKNGERPDRSRLDERALPPAEAGLSAQATQETTVNVNVRRRLSIPREICQRGQA